MRTVALALLAAFAAAIAPAQTVAPELLLLARVKAHLRETLSRLPDFTCRETLRRFYKPAGSNERLKPNDALQLEVLYSRGRELYALPGEASFGEQDVSAFISEGMIGNGNFALYLESTVLASGAVFRYAGEEEIAGRRTARYDFRLSPVVSGLVLNSEGKSGRAGTTGSAWADPQTLEVVRLVSRAEEIPPEVPVAEAVVTMNYAPARIGRESIMLPKDGEFYLRTTSGREDRNLYEFTGCREFQVKSSISFGAEAGEAGGGASGNAPAELPAGIKVTIALSAPITEKGAVNASIEGEVVSDVVRDHRTLIPKGAVAHGRIRQFKTYETKKGLYFVVGIEFTEIEAGGARIAFHADLVKVDRVAGLERELTATRTERAYTPRDATGVIGLGSQTYTTTDRFVIPDMPGVGSFFMRGESFEVPKGFQSVWKTRAAGK